MDKTTQERIKADALKAAEGIGDEHRKNAYYHGHRDGATAENNRAQPIISFLEEVSDSSCDYESVNFSPPFHSKECRACKAKELLQQWKGEKEVDQAKAKDGIIRVILASAYEVSKDAASAEEYLKSEGVDVAHLKANAQYFTWKAELIKITKEKTGEAIVKINDEEAVKWYNDGFTPEQTFRETWQSDGD